MNERNNSYCEARIKGRCRFQDSSPECDFPENKYQCEHYLVFKFLENNVDKVEKERIFKNTMFI